MTISSNPDSVLLPPDLDLSVRRSAAEWLSIIRGQFDPPTFAGAIAAYTPKPDEDRVRVLRLYCFEGPRSAIGEQLKRSLQDGTSVRRTGHRSIFHETEISITVATLGRFPEILPSYPSSPDVIEYGPMRVYCADAGSDKPSVYGRTAEIYYAAVDAGATHIDLGVDEKGTCTLRSLMEFATLFIVKPRPASTSTGLGDEYFSSSKKGEEPFL